MKPVSRSVEQKTNMLGFPKPSEFIEMTGVHVLEASDRAIFNVLYQLAHDSGKIMDQNAEWEIPLATLRQSFSRHESTDRLRDSLKRLNNVEATVRYLDDDGEPRLILTHLFEFFDMPERETNSQQTVRFGLPRKILPVIRVPARWGRIKAEIVCYDQQICHRTL